MMVAESQPGIAFQPKVDAYTERGLFETVSNDLEHTTLLARFTRDIAPG